MIRCPKCKSDNYYFDGAFIKCRNCDRTDWYLQTMSKEDWDKLLTLWGKEMRK